MGDVTAVDFVKVECKQTCLQDAMLFVTQAKAASEAAVNVVKVMFPEADDSKDYIKISKPLLDATSLLVETLEVMQDLVINLDDGLSGETSLEASLDAGLEGDLEDGGLEGDPDGGGEDNNMDLDQDQDQEQDEDQDLDLDPDEDHDEDLDFDPVNELDSQDIDEDFEFKPKIKVEKGAPSKTKVRSKKKSGKIKLKVKVKKDLPSDEELDEKKEPKVDINTGWGDQEYKCNRCKFTTFNKIYFEDHQNGTFNFIKCPFCGLVVYKKEQLGLHVAKEHNMTGTTGYKCDICTKVFKLRRLYALRWHKETDHEGITYHCQLCDHNSKSPLRLQHHHQAKHENMIYMCDKCQYKSRYKRNLTSHMKNVHSGLAKVSKEKKYNICDICGKCVTAKYHMKCLTKQRESSGQVLACNQCDFTTYSQFSLKHHLEEHKGETHMCDQCSYTTTHKTNLVVHIKTVHKERKMLKCDLCEFQTKSHQYMWKHKKVSHSGPVPMLNCHEPDCTFECMFPSDLRRHHDKVHKGIRWACDLCDFSAGYKGDLNRHVKIVHQDYKVDCELCEFSTPKRYYLKEHMVKSHGIDLKKENE